MQLCAAIMQPCAAIMQGRLKKMIPFLVELMQNGDVITGNTPRAAYKLMHLLSWKLKVLKQGLLEGRLKSRARQKILEIASQLGLSTKYAHQKNRF